MAAADEITKDATTSPVLVGGILIGPPGNTLDVSGGLAGGQIGANYRRPAHGSSVSTGRELGGSRQAMHADRHRRGHGELQRQVNALGTFAGRLGFALDRVLFYGKGGTAFANDKYEINSIVAYRANETRWGWMAGAGIEYSFTDNWSAKIEYNYLDWDFRAVRFTDTTGIFGLDTSIRERIHVAKVGINYRFGWAPVGVTY